MLGKAGLKVLKAADGQKALDMLDEGVDSGAPPHIMLLDVMMPGLSGCAPPLGGPTGLLLQGRGAPEGARRCSSSAA